MKGIVQTCTVCAVRMLGASHVPAQRPQQVLGSSVSIPASLLPHQLYACFVNHSSTSVEEWNCNKASPKASS
jgi:hypothetical protein